eukprot:SAG31_NODE_32572_length_354_cov_0.749020_1_plen_36_part_01
MPGVHQELPGSPIDIVEVSEAGPLDRLHGLTMNHFE